MSGLPESGAGSSPLHRLEGLLQRGLARGRAKRNRECQSRSFGFSFGARESVWVHVVWFAWFHKFSLMVFHRRGRTSASDRVPMRVWNSPFFFGVCAPEGFEKCRNDFMLAVKSVYCRKSALLGVTLDKAGKSLSTIRGEIDPTFLQKLNRSGSRIERARPHHEC